MGWSTSGGSSDQPDGRASRPHCDLAESLKACGFQWGRLKTGTPPRLNRRSIDFSVFDRRRRGRPPIPFSFRTDAIEREQIECYLLHTTDRVHELVRGQHRRVPALQRADSWDRSTVLPVARRQGHAVPGSRSTSDLSEPEGLDVDEMYLNGYSMSLPASVQLELVRALPGLESAVMIGRATRSSTIHSAHGARFHARDPSRLPVSSWRAKSTGRRVTKKPRLRGSSPESTRRGRSRAMGRCCSTAARATSVRSSTI